MVNFDSPVETLFGIGDKTATILKKAGIITARDLIENYPRTYRQYRATTISEARVGEWVILEGTLTRPISRHTNHTTNQISSFKDKSGTITLRWFNMPYLARTLESGPYQVLGQITVFGNRPQIVSPTLRKIKTQTEPKDEYLPIYRAIGSLKPGILRHKIATIINNLPPIPETLQDDILHSYNLISRDTAIRHIHSPPDLKSLELAIRRLSWEELYHLQLENLTEHQKSRQRQKTNPLNINIDIVNSFLQTLPFTPTSAQQKAIAQILQDLSQKVAMHRLLQGEVGSGKTLVAATAGLATYTANKKTLILAPTTILAEQLYQNISHLLKDKLTISLYVSSHKGSLTADIIVGTHALLHAKQKLDNIGLIIVDEQHRFGVEDREALTHLQPTPHFLMMTATPIPRSLAMTIFHYLDITRLDEVPSDRLPVKTYLVEETKRSAAYNWMLQEIKKGQQVFMVTPLIEVAEENDENPLKSVKELSLTLKKYFPNINIDILHGKMKDREKINRLKSFRDGATQILVATSMVEVGIDIPSANIMVIENAERFGLAQLHQLRGRVGRGGGQGYCLLFSQAQNPKTQARLSYFVKERNGEKLAEYDMKNRGPGELYGNLQSGFFNLKVGNLWDQQMLEETYQAAKQNLNLVKLPLSS